jgi:hypothetical protein
MALAAGVAAARCGCPRRRCCTNLRAARPAAPHQQEAGRGARRVRGGGGLACASDSAAEPVTERASQDAYNRAMQAYSASPFSYQHEAGLCAWRADA